MENLEMKMREFVEEKGIKVGSKISALKLCSNNDREIGVVQNITFEICCGVRQLTIRTQEGIIDMVEINPQTGECYFVYDSKLVKKEQKKVEINQFSKNDLKNGMVVTYRDGRKRLVVNGILFAENSYGEYDYASTLDYYTDNLLYTKEQSSKFDIVKVTYMEEVLYTREEPEVELVTYEQAMASGKRFRYNKNKKGSYMFADGNIVEDWILCKLSKEDIFEALTQPVWEVKK